MYRERRSLLEGAAVWTRSATGAARECRVLPDGCMDLIWSDGLLVAGPDTHAHLVAETVGAHYVGVRFAPGAGPAVFGVPAHELRDLRVPLDALWPVREVRAMAGRVAEAADRGRALESLAAGRLRGAASPDPLGRLVAARLRHGHRVAAVAREAGLSERQLHRRCRAAFGYGPKTLARVLRLQRALEQARRGVPAGTVAAHAGYADQAHLSREVRDLTGVPLGTLLGR